MQAVKKQDEQLSYSFSRYPGKEMAVFWHRLNSWVEHLGRQYVLLGRKIEWLANGLPRDALTPYNTGSIMRKCLTSASSADNTNVSVTQVVTNLLDTCYNQVKTLSPCILSHLEKAVEKIRELGSKCNPAEYFSSK